MPIWVTYLLDLEYLLDFFALAIIYRFFYYKRWKLAGKRTLLTKTLMFIYLSFVLFFTLMPIISSLEYAIDNLLHDPYGNGRINLIPFDDFMHGRGNVVRELVLNVIMFLPFGFLLPIHKKRGLLFTLLMCIALSCCIELIQPLFHRSFDVTDLITNTTGGLIGFLIYCIFKPLIEKFLSNLKPAIKQ